MHLIIIFHTAHWRRRIRIPTRTELLGPRAIPSCHIISPDHATASRWRNFPRRSRNNNCNFHKDSTTQCIPPYYLPLSSSGYPRLSPHLQKVCQLLQNGIGASKTQARRSRGNRKVASCPLRHRYGFWRLTARREDDPCPRPYGSCKLNYAKEIFHRGQLRKASRNTCLKLIEAEWRHMASANSTRFLTADLDSWCPGHHFKYQHAYALISGC